MPIKKLSHDYSAENLIKGECEIPLLLSTFLTTVLCGTNRRRKNSEYTQRAVSSIAQDIIFAIKKGQVKTSKHITLGLAVKSLTNSKKIINILNKFGHCCSYSVLEGIETEATFTTMNANELCPQEIHREPTLCTGVAFNNFDRFVETSSGKDTLHDTVGIIFQNINDKVIYIIYSYIRLSVLNLISILTTIFPMTHANMKQLKKGDEQ